MAEPGSAASALLCGMAIFAAVLTVVLYLLGLLFVGLTASEVGSGADSTPMHQCRTAPELPPGAQIEWHEVEYLPAGVQCLTTDGRKFSIEVVPPWLDPALAVSFAATVALTAAAFVQEDRRAGARWAATRS